MHHLYNKTVGKKVLRCCVGVQVIMQLTRDALPPAPVSPCALRPGSHHYPHTHGSCGFSPCRGRSSAQSSCAAPPVPAMRCDAGLKACAQLLHTRPQKHPALSPWSAHTHSLQDTCFLSPLLSASCTSSFTLTSVASYFAEQSEASLAPTCIRAPFRNVAPPHLLSLPL